MSSGGGKYADDGADGGGPALGSPASSPGVAADEGADEETKQRVFHFAVDKITMSAESKLDNCFLEFEVGGQSVEDETDDVIEKVKTKKHTRPDGTVEEKEIVEAVNLKMVRVKKTPTLVYMSYRKGVIKAKTTEKFVFDRIDGYWRGSYADLEREYLTVRVWSSPSIAGTNVLVGECRERFLDIADSKVDRSLDIRRRSGAAREETVCVVRFKCELQEWFRFQIKFQNWDLAYTKEELEAMRRLRDTECPVLCYDTRLHFQVHRSQATLTEACCTSMLCCLRGDRASLAVRENLKTAPGGGRDAVAVVTYPGTRNWLEDEELLVEWSKGVCGAVLPCCETTVGRARVPLQGTLDYGYILSHLFVRRDACSCYCAGARVKEALLSACALTQICFGPTCNCGRDGYSLLGSELDKEARERERAAQDAAKREQFVQMALAGVVTCDTVPRHRQQGNVDPAKRTGLLALTQARDEATYLVVKVIRAKGLACVDEVKEMLNPCVTAEWLGIQKRTKTVFNSSNPYWDYDIFFKIRDDKGPPRKYEDFPELARNSKLTLSIWDEDGLSRAVLGFAELDFRTLYEKREEKLTHIFSSDAKVPHLVYEAKLALEVPFTQVAEDKRAREQLKQLEAEHKYLEVMVYFDRVDNYSVDNRRIATERHEPPQAALDRRRTAQYSRARALWNESLRHVEARDRRYFAFFGKDEYTGDFHFLPTFMKPMHPPANMKDLSEIFYYVFSMEVAVKPPVEADEARRRRALAGNDPCSPIKYSDVWVWSDPYFFFEKKKGDVRDHALLLCNFLLGLGIPKDQFNAFVCIGTVRQAKGQPPAPHTWVMTQEHFPHQKRPIVRFWELKTGTTIVLDGPRCAAVYQHDLTRARRQRDAAEREERKRAQQAALEAAAQGQPVPAGARLDANGVVVGPDGQPLRDMSWDRVGRKMEDALAAFNPNDDAALLDLVDDKPVDATAAAAAAAADYGAMPAGAGNIYSAAAVSQVEVEREGALHRQALLREFLHEQEERFPDPKDRFWDAGAGAAGGAKRGQTPYVSLDVVFNHECLFANLQQASPEVIMFELEKEKRWVEFAEASWQECFEYPVLAPFYKERAIVSILAPERDIAALRADMATRLKDGLATHRSYAHQYETVFFDRFEFGATVVGLETVEDYAKQRLEAEARVGMRDESLRALDAERATDAASRAALKSSLKGSMAKLKAKVARNLREGVQYQERLFHFKHADANRIGDQIQRNCADFLSYPDDMQPRFQLFVDVERLPGQISPVRVLVMVMFGHAKE